MLIILRDVTNEISHFLVLGQSVQLIQVWLYDEGIIDQTLDTPENSQIKTTSILSYAVAVVSKADILDASALKLQLEQYLLTKLVVSNNAANSTACASQ